MIINVRFDILENLKISFPHKKPKVSLSFSLSLSQEILFEYFLCVTDLIERLMYTNSHSNSSNRQKTSDSSSTSNHSEQTTTENGTSSTTKQRTTTTNSQSTASNDYTTEEAEAVRR